MLILSLCLLLLLPLIHAQSIKPVPALVDPNNINAGALKQLDPTNAPAGALIDPNGMGANMFKSFDPKKRQS